MRRPDAGDRARRPGLVRAAVLIGAIAALTAAGCTAVPEALGGREPCWGEEPRVASLMQGTLQIGLPGTYLATPEGEQLPLVPAALSIETTPAGVRLVDRAGVTLAAEGDVVTLFGGIGPDGMAVCDVTSRDRP